jgi:amino acid permease
VIFILIIITILTHYSGVLMIICMYTNNKYDKQMDTVSKISEKAFGRIGGYIIKLFCWLNLLGACWVYTVLSGLNIQSICLDFFGVITFPTYVFYCLIGLVVFVPLVFVDDIKEAGWLSVFGTLTTFVAFMVICIYSIINISNSKTSSIVSNNKPHGGSKLFVLEGFSGALTTFAFAFSGNVIFPQVQKSMKNKDSWNLALLLSLIFVFFIYATITVIGYLAFRELTMSPIYNNLNKHSIVVMLTLLFITGHFLCATPIFLCTLSGDIENTFFGSKIRHKDNTNDSLQFSKLKSKTITISIRAMLVALILSLLQVLLDL